MRMLWAKPFNVTSESLKKINLHAALLTGLALGFISGVIGIGGGIFLSPILILLHWADMKKTAAVSALFIFVNSLSGFSGIAAAGLNLNPQLFLWVPLAAAGGFVGSYIGSSKLTTITLRYTLAAVLCFASVKLFLA